ncbi:MAG: DUF4148 domain-containing protein [Janthinobacterium lividum]
MSRLALVRALAVTAALSGALVSVPVFAQGSGASTASDSTTAPATPKAARATRRAQHRAARKAARADQKTQIKSLQSQGVNLNNNDDNYPNNVPGAAHKTTGQDNKN